MALATGTVTRLCLDDWLGVLATGQTFFVEATHRGEASQIMLYDYLRLPLIAAAELAILNVLPDVWILPGAILIIGSAIYIARREAWLQSQRQQRANNNGRQTRNRQYQAGATWRWCAIWPRQNRREQDKEHKQLCVPNPREQGDANTGPIPQWKLGLVIAHAQWIAAIKPAMVSAYGRTVRQATWPIEIGR